MQNTIRSDFEIQKVCQKKINQLIKLTLFQDYSTQEYIIETQENCPKTKTKKKEEKNYCSRFRTQQ